MALTGLSAEQLADVKFAGKVGEARLLLMRPGPAVVLQLHQAVAVLVPLRGRLNKSVA